MKIQIINENDWEKLFQSSKNLIRIGSQVTCDVVVTGPDILPLHMQILAPGDGKTVPQLRTFANNIVLTRGDMSLPVQKLVPMELLEGDKLILGNYRLIIHLEDEKSRFRKSEHISAELSLPNKELSPDVSVSGTLTLKNLGTEKPCQFRMKISGIPDECLQSAPMPYLYPGGVGTVGFVFSHLKTIPAPGFHTVSIIISAPNEYYGEMLEFNQDIYIQPVFQTDFNLEDDSSLYKTEKTADSEIKPAIQSASSAGIFLTSDESVPTEPAPKEEQAIVVIKKGGQDDFQNEEDVPQPEPEPVPITRASRKRKKLTIPVIRHQIETLFSGEAPAVVTDSHPTVSSESSMPDKPTNSDDPAQRIAETLPHPESMGENGTETRTGVPSETGAQPKTAPETRKTDIPVVYHQNNLPFEEEKSPVEVSDVLTQVPPEVPTLTGVQAETASDTHKTDIPVVYYQNNTTFEDESTAAVSDHQTSESTEAQAQPEPERKTRVSRKRRKIETPIASPQNNLPRKSSEIRDQAESAPDTFIPDIPVIHHQNDSLFEEKSEKSPVTVSENQTSESTEAQAQPEPERKIRSSRKRRKIETPMASPQNNLSPKLSEISEQDESASETSIADIPVVRHQSNNLFEEESPAEVSDVPTQESTETLAQPESAENDLSSVPDIRTAAAETAPETSIPDIPVLYHQSNNLFEEEEPPAEVSDVLTQESTETTARPESAENDLSSVPDIRTAAAETAPETSIPDIPVLYHQSNNLFEEGESPAEDSDVLTQESTGTTARPESAENGTENVPDTRSTVPSETEKQPEASSEAPKQSEPERKTRSSHKRRKINTSRIIQPDNSMLEKVESPVTVPDNPTPSVPDTRTEAPSENREPESGNFLISAERDTVPAQPEIRVIKSNRSSSFSEEAEETESSETPQKPIRVISRGDFDE